MPDAVAALEWSYDSDPATAARICAGLAYFRPNLGASASLDRQCDWLIHFDRSSDPASWAIGVAGTALAASIARRCDLLAICADARAALDPADRFHHRILAFPLAFLAQIEGDDSEMATIAAEAVDAGDDLTVLAAAGSMALVATRSGYVSEARRFLDQVEVVLRRHETELDPGVSGFASQAALELAALTGDFVAADELAATMRESFELGGSDCLPRGLLGHDDRRRCPCPSSRVRCRPGGSAHLRTRRALPRQHGGPARPTLVRRRRQRSSRLARQ